MYHNGHHWYCKNCYIMMKAKGLYDGDIVLDMTPESDDWIRASRKKEGKK